MSAPTPRRGRGRPPTGKVTYRARLTPQQVSWLKKQGGIVKVVELMQNAEVMA